MTMESPVLVLNRSFAALALTDVKRGFTLFFKGHVRAVLPDYTTYDWDEWQDIPVQATDDDVVRTPSMVLKVPRVLQLLSCDRPPRNDVKFSRHNIYLRDGTRCQYCGKRFSTSDLSLDHVTPLSRGGKSSWENIVRVPPVQRAEGKPSARGAGMKLRRQPVKPKASPLGPRAASHPSGLEELPGRRVLERSSCIDGR
jgi:5-methylcytosine-specific restriction endonuclease McrA